MRNIKFGLNPLAFIACIFLAISLLYPWWTLEISINNQPTDIYPYLIDGPASEIIGYKRSPQMSILFYLLLFCIFLFVIGSFIKGKTIVITTALAAVLVLLALWRFLARIAGVAAMYEVPIQGHGVGSYGGFALVDVYTFIQPGIYLALSAAIFGFLSSIFHKKLTEKYQINWSSNSGN